MRCTTEWCCDVLSLTVQHVWPVCDISLAARCAGGVRTADLLVYRRAYFSGTSSYALEFDWQLKLTRPQVYLAQRRMWTASRGEGWWRHFRGHRVRAMATTRDWFVTQYWQHTVSTLQIMKANIISTFFWSVVSAWGRDSRNRWGLAPCDGVKSMYFCHPILYICTLASLLLPLPLSLLSRTFFYRAPARMHMMSCLEWGHTRKIERPKSTYTEK